MKHVDEANLEADVNERYRYVADFIGFDEQDVQAIHGAVAFIAPLIPSIVERTYEKLLSYDATARHFLPRQHGYEGPTPDSLDSLTPSHPQIQFRKDHLNRYLMHLIGHAYNEKMVAFLDMAGKMHTPKAGNREIDVPLVQMNALLGLLADCLLSEILKLELDEENKQGLVRAFNKLLWIQNDLVVRHYENRSAG